MGDAQLQTCLSLLSGQLSIPTLSHTYPRGQCDVSPLHDYSSLYSWVKHTRVPAFYSKA